MQKYLMTKCLELANKKAIPSLFEASITSLSLIEPIGDKIADIL